MSKKYPTYKPSGVEWIGEIPEHWKVKRLKHVVSVNDDVLSENTDPDQSFTYVEISDVQVGLGITNYTELLFKDAPSRARRLVQNGDVIVSTVRTYLKAVARIIDPRQNLVVSTGFAVLRPKNILSSYLGYVIESKFIEEVVRRSTGVSYPAINSTELVNIEVCFPPIKEQQTISTYLDQKTSLIDETIRKKQRLIDLLQEERTALINQAVTRGLNPDVPLKPSGVEWLGDVPEHWEVKRLKFLVKLRNEKAQKNLPLTVALENVESWTGKLIPSKTETILEGELKKFEKDDVLFNKLRPYLAKVVQAPSEGRCVGELLVLVAHKLTPRFLFYRLLSSTFIKEVDGSTYGSKMPRASWEDFISQMRIPYPPKEEQEKITSWLDMELSSIVKVTLKIEQEITLLQEYRTALINEVVTGKRCVLHDITPDEIPISLAESTTRTSKAQPA